MLTISQLADRFGLSRSTLLYYDRIGLLSPSMRSGANYRLYSEADVERMEAIDVYRQAGLPLADIARVLASGESVLAERLELRLRALNDEIRKLRRQQQMIVRLLRNEAALVETGSLDKKAWVAILRATGLSEEDMERWHVEFERHTPEAHQEFLESLGIADDEIAKIRQWSRDASPRCVMQELPVALGIGLAAGISPGPLLTLVISATMERGFGAGMRVACAPLLSDLPVVVASLWMMSRVPEAFLTGVTVFGGLFVIYLGLGTISRSRKPHDPRACAGGGGQDLLRGALINLLNPHAWIFWLSVGIPLTLKLWQESRALAAGWVVAFYCGLVGSKIVLAWVVAKGRKRLDQRWYRGVLALCGAALVVLGGLLCWQGARGWLGGI